MKKRNLAIRTKRRKTRLRRQNWLDKVKISPFMMNTTNHCCHWIDLYGNMKDRQGSCNVHCCNMVNGWASIIGLPSFTLQHCPGPSGARCIPPKASDCCFGNCLKGHPCPDFPDC